MLTYRGMRKKHRKLKLTAESLRNLSYDTRAMARVAGGRFDDDTLTCSDGPELCSIRPTVTPPPNASWRCW